MAEDAPTDRLRGHVDAPEAGATVERGIARVTGWVLDAEGLLDTVRIAVDGGPSSLARLGVWRSDVGEAFPGTEHAATSGFEGTIDLRAAAGERASIAVLARLGDGTWREAARTEVALTTPARPRGGARPRAAFTVVHNESLWLPLWLRHYERSFGPEDIWVLDHASTDGSTAGLEDRCRVVPIHHDAAFDHHWLKSTVERFQAFLLQSYDAVLFAEADELVVADPRRYPDLGAYIDAMEGPAARCSGWNVVHRPGEPAIDFDRPLLAQREWWHASLPYCKRLIGRVPLRWSDGFHTELDAPDDAPDPDLLLVHGHRIDYDACLARHSASAALDWNAADIVARAGAHNRVAGGEKFDAWFRNGPDLDTPPERIPAHLREVL